MQFVTLLSKYPIIGQSHRLFVAIVSILKEVAIEGQTVH
jgi:hypothetical protein